MRGSGSSRAAAVRLRAAERRGERRVGDEEREVSVLRGQQHVEARGAVQLHRVGAQVHRGRTFTRDPVHHLWRRRGVRRGDDVRRVDL